MDSTKSDNKKKLAALLAKHQKYFDVQADGKLVCLANGHAVPAKFEALSAFVNGKKFAKMIKRYDAEQSLEQFAPFITQSKNFPNMLYCALTGQLMDKSIDAAKKHMLGKKYVANKGRYDENNFPLKPEPNIEDVLKTLNVRAGRGEEHTADDLEEGEEQTDVMPSAAEEDMQPGPSKRARLDRSNGTGKPSAAGDEDTEGNEEGLEMDCSSDGPLSEDASVDDQELDSEEGGEMMLEERAAAAQVAKAPAAKIPKTVMKAPVAAAKAPKLAVKVPKAAAKPKARPETGPKGEQRGKEAQKGGKKRGLGAGLASR